MKHSSLGHKILRILLWAAGSLVVLAILIPALLYLPPVQDFAKSFAEKEIKRATGMTVDIERLRLRWPLKLSVDRATVVEASGDTMLTARRLDLGVKMLPLLKGVIDVDYAMLDSATYNLGNADSLMWLRARIDRFELEASSLSMEFDKIDLDRALLDGATVNLTLRPDTATTTQDTTPSNQMVIKARDIELRNITYTMSMLPTVDSIGCVIPSARLNDGVVDMGNHKINARFLGIDSVSAAYLTPSAAYLRTVQPATAPSDSASMTEESSQEWTITADSLRLTASDALYAQRGVRPAPGLDMGYLSVCDVAIDVDSFYNRGTSLKVPLKRLKATERCGLTINAGGLFEMTPEALKATGINITTNASDINFDAMMGLSANADKTPLYVNADARLGMSDAVKAFPALAGLVRSLPRPPEVDVKAEIDGSMESLDIRHINILYPGMARLETSGHIDNPTDFARMSGNVSLKGRMTGLHRLRPTLTQIKLDPSIALPERMTLDGNIKYSPNIISGTINATANDGHIAATGKWQRNVSGYSASIETDHFPVDAFMPSLGIGAVSATLTASGQGYNPLAAGTSANVSVDIHDITYNHETYSNIIVRAGLDNGHAEGTLSSDNRQADLDIDFDATITDSLYVWDIDGDIRNIDLMALHMSTDTMGGTFTLASKGCYSPLTRNLDASMTLDHVDWIMGNSRLTASTTTADLTMTDSTLNATVTNRDMRAVASAGCGLSSLMSAVDSTSQLINRSMAAKRIDIDSLKAALPPLDLSVSMGRNNFVSEYLSSSGSGIGFDHMAATVATRPLISMSGSVNGLTSGTTRIDTLTVTAIQRGSYLAYNATVGNRPGTMDAFAHVNVNGFIGKDRVGALLRQSDIQGKQGYKIGFSLIATDSVATLKLVPRKPRIAYRDWILNDDNFISYNFINHSVKADLKLSDSISSLEIATQECIHGDSHMHHSDSTGIAGQEDIIVKLKDIKIQDWLAVSPFAPPMKGDLSADMRFHWDRRDLTGKGAVRLDRFYYGRERVGDFLIDVDVANDPATGIINADMSLMVDSVKTITVNGVLNDSTSHTPFRLDMSMIHMPLSTVNPFLPQGTARLSGTMNGKMEIKGSPSEPKFNGWIEFDSTAVNVTMLGTQFKFPSTRIPVDSNIVRFNKFAIMACNENPVTIDGSVDMRSLSNPQILLNVSAENTMIVNSTRPKSANVYGKAYIDLNADVSGNMSFMTVKANAAVLAGTNVTYVMTTATDNLPGVTSSGDMVRFVQFSDTTAVVKADSVATTMAMMINADLDIRQGSTINVDLSADGKNKVQVQGQGNLDFSMSPVNPSGRLTGRYTIDKGFVRYSPPMMSEKLFEFEEGSYVAFNGDMMNPTLNVHAVDRIKANVTQEGQNSRLVNFDVGLSVTNSLQNMNVAFDLSTDDDITVQNELQGMSAEQRANQAMNLLLYNVYTGPGTSGTASLGGNPLFSFLESQINSWAANNIKGVDISFGIEQYDRTYEGSTSTATSYSYRVSKSLFNDRFKIVVGGNYTTDANADENFAENLLNDISFEYMLNKSGSMYVRLFRHTGYESILEGEVTQTGVGFVLKRKLTSLRDLFNFGRRRKIRPSGSKFLNNSKKQSDKANDRNAQND